MKKNNKKVGRPRKIGRPKKKDVCIKPSEIESMINLNLSLFFEEQKRRRNNLIKSLCAIIMLLWGIFGISLLNEITSVSPYLTFVEISLSTGFNCFMSCVIAYAITRL